MGRKKIVYCGTQGAGKTTTLEKIYDNLPAESKQGRLELLGAGPGVYYESFVFLYLNITFSLFTTPGALLYNKARLSILQGADAIIFVTCGNYQEDQAALYQTLENLAELKAERIRIVFQDNKADLRNLEIEKRLDYKGRHFKTIATKGAGVFPTLKYTCGLIIEDLEKYNDSNNLANAKTFVLSPNLDNQIKEAASNKFCGRAYPVPNPDLFKKK